MKSPQLLVLIAFIGACLFTGCGNTTLKIESALLQDINLLVLPKFLIGFTARVAGSADVLKTTLYKLYLSEQSDCSNPILVQDFGPGIQVDMAKAASLFQANLEEGSFPCMAIELSDTFIFSPSGVEASNPEYSYDHYPAERDNLWKDVGGNPIVATDGPDRILLFASVDFDVLEAGPIAPYGSQIVLLSHPINAKDSRIFFSDPQGKVLCNRDACRMDGIGFGVR